MNKESKNDVFKKGCHSQKFLLGISHFHFRKRKLERLLNIGNKQAEDPRQNPSGMTTNGFTLIELLIVVLIIGILTAIALPQYQMTVGKAQFSTLKSVTKYAAEFAQLYYLSHGTYGGSSSALTKEIPSEVSCSIWQVDDFSADYNKISCCKKIFNSKTCLYATRDTEKLISCLVWTDDKNNLAYKLCKKETGSPGDYCSHAGYCSCLYR